MEQADLVFLVDSSLSIKEYHYPGDDTTDNWYLVKVFLGQLIKNLPVSENGTHIGVIPYSTNVDTHQVIYLNDHKTKDPLVNEIMNLNYVGTNTNTSGALRYMREEVFSPRRGERSGVNNIGFLITDGLSNVDDELTAYEAREVKNAGIRLFALGISRYADEAELQEIASDPVSYYTFLAEDFKNLAYLQDQVLTRLCQSKPPPPTRKYQTFMQSSPIWVISTPWFILE